MPANNLHVYIPALPPFSYSASYHITPETISFPIPIPISYFNDLRKKTNSALIHPSIPYPILNYLRFPDATFHLSFYSLCPHLFPILSSSSFLSYVVHHTFTSALPIVHRSLASPLPIPLPPIPASLLNYLFLSILSHQSTGRNLRLHLSSLTLTSFPSSPCHVTPHHIIWCDAMSSDTILYYITWLPVTDSPSFDST